MSALAPWLQTALDHLLPRAGHAWLIQGSSGLGQYDLALALAQSWLCHSPTPHGACGTCPSCHGIEVRVHADFRVLMPETEALERGWPLGRRLHLVAGAGHASYVTGAEFFISCTINPLGYAPFILRK